MKNRVFTTIPNLPLLTWLMMAMSCHEGTVRGSMSEACAPGDPCPSGQLCDGGVCTDTGPRPTPGLLAAPAPSPECTANGNQYYVTSSSVNGDGSLANPFNTMQQAIDLAMPGDIVYVMPGDYAVTTRTHSSRHGTADQRICVMAYDPDDRPILSRADGYGGEFFLIKHRYFVLDGFVMNGMYTSEDYFARYDNSDDPEGRREYAFRNLVAIPHYGGCSPEGSGDMSFNYDGDHAIVRNCDMGHNRVDVMRISADDVLVENCEIHHALRGDFEHQEDAHGIGITHARHVTLRHLDIHHLSGDCIQADPDVENRCQTQQWDKVSVEHSRLWTGPLVGEHAEFHDGENPGENGIDTKTFEDEQYRVLRPRMRVFNVEAFGWSPNGFISNRAVFNIKYRVDWFMDGILVHGNQFAFRIRGGYDNEAQGSARVRMANVVAYDTIQAVARVERDIEQLEVYNSTFGDNAAFFLHVDCPADPCYDTAGYKMQNTLFVAGALPADAEGDSSNLAVEGSCFVDGGDGDFRLTPGCAAIDAGVDVAAVANDVSGAARPPGAYDIGAWEWQP